MEGYKSLEYLVGSTMLIGSSFLVWGSLMFFIVMDDSIDDELKEYTYEPADLKDFL